MFLRRRVGARIMPNRILLIIKIISKRVIVEAVHREPGGGVDGLSYQYNAWIREKIIVAIKP